MGWQEKIKDSAFIAVKTDFRSFVFSFSDHYLNVAIREFTGSTRCVIFQFLLFTVRMDIAKVSKNIIKCVATGEMVELQSLWAKQTAVVVFLRRFG